MNRLLLRMDRAAFILLIFISATWTAAGETKPPETSKFNDYDEVVAGLLQNLAKDRASAEDAAAKLGSLGRHALGPLIDVLEKACSTAKALEKDKDKEKEKSKDKAREKEKEKTDQVIFFATMALSRIKSPDAGTALLPIIKDQTATIELRCLAIEANGLDNLDEGFATLQEIASSDPDIRIRRKAFKKFQTLALSTKIAATEKLFVTALSDPDEEIRFIAAQQCLFVPIFKSAIPKLIEIAQKDPVENVRLKAIHALGQMHARESVAPLVRLCLSDDSPKSVKTAALLTIQKIANIGLKDNGVLKTWWEKAGEKEFGKLEIKPTENPEAPKDDTAHSDSVATPQKQPDPEKR